MSAELRELLTPSLSPSDGERFRRRGISRIEPPHLTGGWRRGSTLVGFAGGLLFFGERNARQKIPAVIGILLGIALTVLG